MAMKAGTPVILQSQQVYQSSRTGCGTRSPRARCLLQLAEVLIAEAIMTRVVVVLGLIATVIPVSPVWGDTYWNHNGSTIYLSVDGDKRQFFYSQPRPGMLKAGARPGDAIFEGKSIGGRYIGTAYLYNPRCGKHPYQVEGPVLNNGGKVVLKGRAPKFNRKCKVKGTKLDTLNFELIEPTEGLPDAFLGVWKLKVKGEQDACKSTDYRNFDNAYMGSVFQVNKKNVQYWHSGCNFIYVRKTPQENVVSVDMSCGGEGISWSSKGTWAVHDGFLSMSVVNSTSSDQDGKLEKGGIGAELAVKCTNVPERTDIPVMPRSYGAQ